MSGVGGGGVIIFMQSQSDGDSVVLGEGLLAVTLPLPSSSELHISQPI